MAKKVQKYYYVMVMTDKGPKFVTKINYSNKTAEWNVNEKPIALEYVRAKDMTIGLIWNGFCAFTVVQEYECDTHPYRYDKWEIEWKLKEGEDNE